MTSEANLPARAAGDAPRAQGGSPFLTPSIFRKIELIANKSYLQTLGGSEIVPCADAAPDVAETACFFPIVRIVLDKKEDSLQKLASVYASAGSMGSNLAMLIRGYASGGTEIYLGACGEDSRINGAYPRANGLLESFVGNFPGCRDRETAILSREATRILQNKFFDLEYNSAASVSCIASTRGEEAGAAGLYQGMDKVIETMSQKDYSLLILATPLPPEEITRIQEELESLYTTLSVFGTVQMSVNWSEAQSISRSYSETMSDSIGRTKSASLNVGCGTTHSHSFGSFESMGTGLGAGGMHVNVSDGTNESDSTGSSQSFGQAISDALSETVGVSASKGAGASDTHTVGETIQMSVENKTVSDLLRRIDEQLKRLRRGKGLGMFAAAAYVLTPSPAQSRLAASAFKSIVSGSSTELEHSAVNVWTGPRYGQVLSYLRQFRHPVFRICTEPEEGERPAREADVTPAALTTSSELAILMGLPRKKVNGIPVRESVAFERNVIRMDRAALRDELTLGNIYYLDHEETNSAALNLDSLTMHCFVTGTTGSGKSNAVYGLLDAALAVREGLHFMVVEPAKGEYKTVFGRRDGVFVYGTNDAITPLLRINPFRFREGVHVLEHIDFLISIFNVCWPMEAAMPSILKQAVERAYVHAGWDLKKSRNRYSDHLFPSFEDVLCAVNRILEESDYSAENKGNYKGALCTRLRELTTGMYSQIFVSDDLTDEELFCRNVIVDLSRIVSPETKALLMGLMIVRLKEYRQNTAGSFNSGLRHITVLEEAHNLLKRTSTEQAMSGANIAGKAVEMLANSLAEVRSSGEGFVIVDQAPGQLDLSVIRNTNTKIVLRLPEAGDRELVGRAISLNDGQIEELAKLPTGVAAVYQNDWFGAALVKMPYHPVEETPYCQPDAAPEEGGAADALGYALAEKKLDAWLRRFAGQGTEAICRLPLSGETKRALCEYAAADDASRHLLLPQVAYHYFHADEAVEKAGGATNPARIRTSIVRALSPDMMRLSVAQQDFLVFVLIQECAARSGRCEKLSLLYGEHMRKTYL